MEFQLLAPGLTISRIASGLWQIADMERHGVTLNPTETAEAMRPLVDAGFTTFDMADHYGSAEIIAGTFRNQVSDKKKVQLLTKWVPKPGNTLKDEVRTAVKVSLDRLQSQSLDLLQFHAWNYADPNWLDVLFWLQELREEGLIQHLGLTNFDAAHLRIAAASGIPIISNQVCYSLIDQRAKGQMAKVCEAYDIKILAFGTLAGGFFSEKWVDKSEPEIEKLDTWSEMKYKRFIDAAGGWLKFQKLLKAVDEIARKHNASIANVASRFILDSPHVGGILLGARLGKSNHIQENLKTFEFQLDEDDRQRIQYHQEALDPIPGECGDEYRYPPFLTASGDLSDHIEQIPPPYKAEPVGTDRKKVLTGTIWEDIAGFSRATRLGNRILVSGTTATHGTKLIGGNDPAAQTHFIIDKIRGAIESLGGKFENIIRTRIYVNDSNDWEPISRAHGERFRHIQPANTLVHAGLIGEGYLVEMEAEAMIVE